MTIIHHTSCPACNSGNIREVFTVKDHTVSGYLFPIWECSDCQLRFTQDIPDENFIGEFYKSEEYISHTDKAPGLINRIYRIVRKKTLRGKRKLVNRLTGLTKGELLDIGSGTGAFVNEMMKNGWKVTGLEPDPDARKVAKQSYDLKLEHTDQLKTMTNESFDAITLWHVLEHVHDLHQYLEKLRNLIKKDGRIFIAVPNYRSMDSAIYQDNWAAYDVPRHLYHFSPASMKKLLEKHQLKLLHQKPMWFDSFYISMLSSRYRKGRTNLPAAIINGMRSNLKAMRDKEFCSSIIYVAGRS